MEKEKSYKGLVIVLAVLVVVLGALCVLFATGIISFSNKTNESSNTETNSNIEISYTDLNKAIDILGLGEVDDEYTNSYNQSGCLNYYISDSNFRDNSKMIFHWYAALHKLYTYHEDAMYDTGVANVGKVSVYNCADCSSIRIDDATNIIKTYKLIGLEEQLGEMPEPYKNTEYTVNTFNLTKLHPAMCNIAISHDYTAKYGDDESIIVIDKQNITEYKYNETAADDEIKSTKNQSVTYNLKKDTDGNYYLDNVAVTN